MLASLTISSVKGEDIKAEGAAFVGKRNYIELQCLLNTGVPIILTIKATGQD